MKRKKKIVRPVYDLPMNGNIKVITIIFDDQTSHYSIVEQFVLGLLKNKYSKEKEILDALQEYLWCFSKY